MTTTNVMMKANPELLKCYISVYTIERLKDINQKDYNTVTKPKIIVE